jgi:predicted RNase H-like HicB family nuclease
MQYTVIVEKGATSWGAYVPDLPGCIAAGDTREDAIRLSREAIQFHVEGLIEQGESVPEPHSFSELVEIDAT